MQAPLLQSYLWVMYCTSFVMKLNYTKFFSCLDVADSTVYPPKIHLPFLPY